jgi:hypothetical protein
MSDTSYLTLREAAEKLRKSERWLWDWLDKHPRDRFDQPYYRLAGRTKLISEADLARIFEDLPSCPSRSGRPAKAKRRTSKSAAPTSDAAWKLAAELTNDPSLKNSSGGSKSASRNTGGGRRPKLSLIQGSRPS